MADKRRRSRRPGSTSHVLGSSPAQLSPAGAGQPEWKWRTLPVFFAFGLGGFLGVYLGMVVQASESDAAFLVVTSVFAVLLGAALSRIVVRYMVGHQWIKAKAKKS